MKAFFCSRALSYARLHHGGRLPEGLCSTSELHAQPQAEPVRKAVRVAGRYGQKIKMNPIINCEKHGMQLGQTVCQHAKLALSQGRFQRVTFFSGFFSTWACDDCMAILSDIELEKVSSQLTASVKNNNERKAEKLYKKFSLKFDQTKSSRVCSECLKEIELSELRSKDKPVPFEVYENTLTYLENEKIEKLEKTLREEFQFPKMTVKEIGMELSSLQVKYGAITHPLSLKIYGINDRQTQGKILKTIKDFFENESAIQRKVSFFTKMGFDKDGSSIKSMPEKNLIFEEIIK